MTASPYASVFRPDLFAGRTVIVTGGGSGIGRCTAHELAALGAHVALVGRTEAKLANVQAEIEEDGGRASVHPQDIRDEDGVTATVAAILKATGRIDALVNNAGGQYPAPAEAITRKGFEAVVRTNLTGGFLMARAVYTQWMRDHGGAIVNLIADMRNGMPMMAHSGAARAGMENLTMTLAVEWARSGVRVNAVAPGWIASSGLDHYDGPTRALIPQLARAVPLQRLGTESEVSAAICFLLSDAAAFISGATLRVDGAAPLGARIWPLAPHDRSRPFEGFHRAVPPKVLTES